MIYKARMPIVCLKYGETPYDTIRKYLGQWDIVVRGTIMDEANRVVVIYYELSFGDGL